MAVIDYTDVETEIGRPLTEAEQGQVTLWITDAEIVIKARLGDLAALDQEALAYVVRMAVAAKFRNPTGVTEETRQIDDFKTTKKFAGANIRIWDEWWEMLAPEGNSTAFTIRPGYPRQDCR